MIRRPPRSTRTDTLFPYTTLFRSLTRCAGLPALFHTCQIPDVPGLAKIGVFSLPCSVSLSPKCIVGRGSMRIEKAALKRSPQKTIAAILAAANHEFGQHGLEGASMEKIDRRCGKTKKIT